jgi:UDP-glucose 6-dehydrogenase
MQKNGVFWVFKSLFLFLKISSQNNNKIFNVWTLFSKIKTDDLKNSKHFNFLHSTRFSYKEINEHDKLKFKDDLIYFLS